MGHDNLPMHSVYNLGWLRCKNRMSQGFVWYSNYRTTGKEQTHRLVDTLLATLTSLGILSCCVGNYYRLAGL